VKRGIEVKRVFIEKATADGEERQCIEDQIAEQKKGGLHIKRVLEPNLSEDSRKNLLLIEGENVAYLGLGSRGKVLEELKISVNKNELENLDLTIMSEANTYFTCLKVTAGAGQIW